jgi:hypothetical protein
MLRENALMLLFHASKDEELEEPKPSLNLNYRRRDTP